MHVEERKDKIEVDRQGNTIREIQGRWNEVRRKVVSKKKVKINKKRYAGGGSRQVKRKRRK